MLYIVKNLRSRPTHLTIYWVDIRGLFNPTLIDRVNNLITNNIRSTYNCHTFMELSGPFFEEGGGGGLESFGQKLKFLGFFQLRSPLRMSQEIGLRVFV